MSGPALESPPACWRPALFGKLPAHGDFLCLGLSDAERTAWDNWASHGLVAAQAALGEGFDAAHGAAPPWSFISGPGVLGDGWRAGAFAPSADKAGRRFVIVAAYQDLTWGDALAFGVRIAAAKIEAVYRMLNEHLSGEDAFSLVGSGAIDDGVHSRTALQMLAAPASAGVWWTVGGEMHAAAVETGPAPPSLERALMPKGSP